jgi:hypothetical protein
MEAVFFDKEKKRMTKVLDKVEEQITIIVTDTNFAGKITYKLSFYDHKKRPVYTELERSNIDVEFK